MRHHFHPIHPFAILIALIFLLFPTGVPAATTYQMGDSFVVGDLGYVVVEGGVCVAGYKDDIAPDIVIPATANGYPVIGIASELFRNTAITSIKFPASLEYINPWAFDKCRNLRSVIFENSSLEYIGYEAFAYCSSLSTLRFGEGLEVIGDGCFKGCTALTQVRLPDSVTYIGSAGFYHCEGLNQVILGNKLEYIESFAFANCPELKSIDIPFQTRIGYRALGYDYGTNYKYPDFTITGINKSEAYYYAADNGFLFNNLTLEDESASGPFEAPHLTLSVNEGGFLLNWNRVGEADGYEIERRVFTTQPFQKIKTLRSFVGSYTDVIDYADDSTVGIHDGSYVTYRIRAIRNGAYSDYSNEVSCYLIRPAEITGIKNTTNGIQLNIGPWAGAWQYQIYRQENGGTAKRIATINVHDSNWNYITSYTDKKVEIGKNYTYKIRGIANDLEDNFVYKGLFSNEVSIVRLLPDPSNNPVTPVSVGKTTLGTLSNKSTGIKLTWKALSGVNGYTIYRKAPGESKYSKYKTLKGAKTISFTDTQTTANKNYSYKIRAYKTVSGKTIYGDYSAAKTYRRMKTPVISSLKNSTTKAMTIKWAKVSGAKGYRIRYSTSSGMSASKVITSKDAATLTKKIKNLTKGKTYYVQVQSFYTSGGKTYYSAWSSPSKVKILK